MSVPKSFFIPSHLQATGSSIMGRQPVHIAKMHSRLLVLSTDTSEKFTRQNQMTLYWTIQSRNLFYIIHWINEKLKTILWTCCFQVTGVGEVGERVMTWNSPSSPLQAHLHVQHVERSSQPNEAGRTITLFMRRVRHWCASCVENSKAAGLTTRGIWRRSMGWTIPM